MTGSDMEPVPSAREMKVLQALCLGGVEDGAQWPSAGRGTEATLIAKGWIEPAMCDIYDTVGFRITEAGQQAHARGWSAGR